MSPRLGDWRRPISFGGFLQPAVAWSLDNVGWRETSVASGLIVLLVGLPLAGLMRHRPEQYGYAVDGDPLGTDASGNGATPALDAALARTGAQ